MQLRHLLGGAAVGFGLAARFAQRFAFDDEQTGDEAIHIASAAIAFADFVFALILVFVEVKAGEEFGGVELFVGLFAAGGWGAVVLLGLGIGRGGEAIVRGVFTGVWGF